MKIYYILIFLFIIYFIYQRYNFYFRIQLLNMIVVKRGIVTLNCKWYNISDWILKDSSGVNLYYDIKNKINKDFYQTVMFGHKLHLLLNPNHIKKILHNSPYDFGPGILKTKFFHSFMKKNIGIQCGCPWKKMRQAVENTLPQKLDFFDQEIDDKMYYHLRDWSGKRVIKYKDFVEFSKKLTGFIIFGEKNLNQVYLNFLKDVNSTSVLWNFNSKQKFKLKNKFNNLLYQSLKNPKEGSLIFNLIKNKNLTKEELKDQIPHFIFPIFSLFITTIPRILLMLSNHSKICQKFISSVKNKNNLYLKNIILEMLRLNNPVNSTFRTVNQDIKFDKYKIKKGEQILILNNAILRNPDTYKLPNQFIPERWNSELEQSQLSIIFNYGPQKCPGKELSIFIIKSFLINLVKVKKLNKSSKIISKKINTKNISQSINPCNLEFIF